MPSIRPSLADLPQLCTACLRPCWRWRVAQRCKCTEICNVRCLVAGEVVESCFPHVLGSTAHGPKIARDAAKDRHRHAGFSSPSMTLFPPHHLLRLIHTFHTCIFLSCQSYLPLECCPMAEHGNVALLTADRGVNCRPHIDAADLAHPDVPPLRSGQHPCPAVA